MVKRDACAAVQGQDPLQRSLFDYVDYASANSYERAIALCLDRDANVLWWYRNLVGKEHFSVQGYRKDRIRPDFVVHGAEDGKPVARVLVLESKGEPFEGNEDTLYKRQVADVFNEVGQKVTWQQLAEDFAEHEFRFQVLDQSGEAGQEWREILRRVVADEPVRAR